MRRHFGRVAAGVTLVWLLGGLVSAQTNTNPPAATPAAVTNAAVTNPPPAKPVTNQPAPPTPQPVAAAPTPKPITNGAPTLATNAPSPTTTNSPAPSPKTNAPVAPNPSTNAPPVTNAPPSTNQVAAQPVTPPQPPAPKPRIPQKPAEQLLPAETLFVLTVKDWTTSASNFWRAPMGRLWNDPVMRNTRERFNTRWQQETVSALERNFKVKLPDWTDLLRGQLTFALTTPPQDGKYPGNLFLMDVGDQTEALAVRLAELQKNWSEAGRKIGSRKIGDVEFTIYQFTQAQLQQFARTVTGQHGEVERDPEAENTKVSMLIGQSQSMLLIGTIPRDLELVVKRQSGAAAPILAAQPAFLANYHSLFKDAPIYAWLDFKPIFEQQIKAPANAAPASRIENLGRVQKVLPALGLGELQSIAVRMSAGPEGYDSTLFLTAPETNRHGVLKILAPPAKDASPPPFVPGDTVQFTRVRIDFPQAYNTFEGILQKIDPSVAGIVQLMINAAGKDRDPNFDMRKSLIESAGDDYVSFDRHATNGVTATVTLIGARNADELLSSLRSLARMLPEGPGSGGTKERKYMDRTIYTLNIGSPGAGMQAGGEMHVVAHAGYVAFSREALLLEEFIRNTQAPPRGLRDLLGVLETGQRAGGLGTGWFSFENLVETTRQDVETRRRDPDSVEDENGLLSLKTISNPALLFSDWIDYKSLPPFEQISKYFYYSTFTGRSTPEGIIFHMATPTAQALK